MFVSGNMYRVRECISECVCMLVSPALTAICMCVPFIIGCE
jgi:hypothetical protein